jgi:hypothetical protein
MEIKNFAAVVGVAFLVVVAIIWVRTTSALDVAVNYEFEPNQRAVLAEAGVSPSMDPKLVVQPSGALYMLVVYGEESRLGVAVSDDGGDTFEAPVPISLAGARVSSHGENSPSLTVAGTYFYALWEQNSITGTDLMFARSRFAQDFGDPIKVTDKSSPSTNAFSTLAVAPNGDIYAAWLDGRDRPQGRPGTSALYMARSTDGGVSFGENRRVALDVCPCCRPSLGFGSENGKVFVAWRKVFENNFRDMVVARSIDGGATFEPGVRVAADGWRIEGCPHSGPAMQAVGQRLYVTWFSEGTGENSGIRLAWSDDDGESFSTPKIISENVLDANHPQLSVSTEGRILVAFQGRAIDANGAWGGLRPYLVEVEPTTGEASIPMEVPGAQRSGSYPTVVAGSVGRVFIAWTESGQNGRQVVMSRARRKNQVFLR